MDNETRTLIAKKFERAQEDLAVAESLKRQGSYRQSISRSYYAVFAAASAALLTQDITRKKHSGVESAFNQYIANPGLVKRKLAALYRDTYEARQEADYADLVEFSEMQADEVLSDAQEFVASIQQFLREQGAIK